MIKLILRIKNPHASRFCWILDTFRMKQTQMHVCTLEECILVDVVSLLYKYEVNWLNGIYIGIYLTGKRMEFTQVYTWQEREVRITFNCQTGVLTSGCVKCHLNVCIVCLHLRCQLGSPLTLKFSSVTQIVRCCGIRISLPIDVKLN